jgi:hypothetical protein
LFSHQGLQFLGRGAVYADIKVTLRSSHPSRVHSEEAVAALPSLEVDKKVWQNPLKNKKADNL